MKKVMVLAMACIVCGIAAKAQCDKNIKWTSLKSEFIDTSGNIENTRNETIVVTTGAKKISIDLQGEHTASMSGDVSNYSCSWKDDKNGKAVFKSTLVDTEGKTRHATITIEEVNGQTTILLMAEEEPTKIRLSVDSFIEVK